MNDNIQTWFEEAKEKVLVFSTTVGEFLIYKGFKISSEEGVFKIEDVRFSNLYSSPSRSNLKYFSQHGFVKGADIIAYHRNLKRIELYRKRAERLYQRRAKFKKDLHKNKRLNEKRIRNINKHIEEYVDYVILYENRVRDFNSKYKNYENTRTSLESLQ